MSEVSMLGLGSMGSALARALCRAGHSLTVWNRSPQKMAPFVALGASGAASVSDAIQASPIIIVCIDSYAATRELLGGQDILPHLSGRTVIQLSTGTPTEARASKDWLNACGVEYIDGAIMPYPSGIGAVDARILFAGPEKAFERCKRYLNCFGGDIRYLGRNIAAAAVLDMALLTHQLCEALGAIHGALLCESEGVGLDTLASMFPDNSETKGLVQFIREDVYDRPGATLTVWNEALRRIQNQASDVGINSEIPDFIASLFERTISAGHGEQDLAAVIKVLRSEGSA